MKATIVALGLLFCGVARADIYSDDLQIKVACNSTCSGAKDEQGCVVNCCMSAKILAAVQSLERTIERSGGGGSSSALSGLSARFDTLIMAIDNLRRSLHK